MPSAAALTADFQTLEKFWADAPVRTVLPNGLTLVVRPDATAEVASVQVWVKTGSVHEGEQLGAGLSHYLEHLLFKGTTKRAGRQISAEVQAHGGNINAYTTFDRTVYYIDLPTEHVGVAVDVLADIVLHSTLPVIEVKKEKDVILREIDMGLDDPDQRLGQALFETAFREHPYRHPIIGHREVFEAVERDALWSYYQARYVPNNLVVVMAGVPDAAQAEAMVAAAFGGAKRRKLAPVFMPAEPALLSARARHLVEKVEVVRAGLSWPVPGLAHEDALVLDVLALVLGHGDSSRLWQAVREKARVVHSIDAMNWTPGEAGLFYVSFMCDSGRREAATRAVHATLRAAEKTGFREAEVRQAIRQLVVSELDGRKTVSGQASRLGMAEVVVGDLDYSRHYFRRLRAVTPARLRDVLRRYLRPERLIEVSLNPLPSGEVVAAAKAPGAGKRPAWIERRVAGGARLLMQPDHRLPSVHLRLFALGGATTDAPARRGATALMATLLTKDTKRRSAAEVARAIEEVGGAFFPFTGNNSFGVAAEVMPSDVGTALALLGEAVREPMFKATSVAVERDAQVAELQQDLDDVVTFGRRRLRRLFFGEQALGCDSQGEIEGLRQVKAADLAALHRRLLAAPNVVLVVTGDFDPAVLGPKLEAWLTRLPQAKVLERKTGPVAATGPVVAGDFVEIQPRQQAVVFQAFPGPGRLDEDFLVAEVADELFSGMSSRLFERVREKRGLAYFVRSARVTGVRGGMFYFYAGTAPGKEGAVITELNREIVRVAAGKVTADELARCQTRLLAGRRMGRQTNGARAMQAGLNALYGLPVDDDAIYDAGVMAVNAAALAKFAKERLARKWRVQLVVRP